MTNLGTPGGDEEVKGERWFDPIASGETMLVGDVEDGAVKDETLAFMRGYFQVDSHIGRVLRQIESAKEYLTPEATRAKVNELYDNLLFLPYLCGLSSEALAAVWKNSQLSSYDRREMAIFIFERADEFPDFMKVVSASGIVPALRGFYGEVLAERGVQDTQRWFDSAENGNGIGLEDMEDGSVKANVTMFMKKIFTLMPRLEDMIASATSAGEIRDVLDESLFDPFLSDMNPEEFSAIWRNASLPRWIRGEIAVYVKERAGAVLSAHVAMSEDFLAVTYYYFGLVNPEGGEGDDVARLRGRTAETASKFFPSE